LPGRYEDNIFFVGDFDEQLENDVIMPLTVEITKQAELKKGRIDLYINSCGGYLHLVNHMTELVEIAKKNDVLVRTIVPDIAFSAGSMLAITGTVGYRYIGRKAEHLCHFGQQMSFETTQEQVERFTAHKKRNFDNNLKHYQKYSKVPDLDKHMLDDGYFIPAPKAIKWGLADAYIEKMELIP
jgi:ATP-dependent protease ClpP protease subunit